ncbi:MAG TPA: YbhN family protein [Xanthobacteraceae bacterium]|nr:YbhN family protein [Xanthobacteraceae bacterium]
MLERPEHDFSKPCTAKHAEPGNDSEKARSALGKRVRALCAQISLTPRSWSKAGLLLSVTIILASAVVLFYRLRDLDWGAVRMALAGVSLAHVAAAAFFVLCGYVTLAVYDWFALRVIGARQVPVPVAALTGVVSYAIGHGIGAMVFASAAIRLRIYSRWGLGLLDIAKMSFIAGLTFWLGNITALSVGMVCMPDAARAVDQISSWSNRAIGTVVLGTLVAYLFWVWSKTRVLGRNASAVTLPSGSMTLLQIAIGLADLSCCSIVMYLLMPSLPAVDFLTLALIVVFGTLAGFASHAPGAIGALDAAMLIGLPTFDRAELVATLLLYRLLYFAVPFAFALAGLGLREAYVHFRE